MIVKSAWVPVLCFMRLASICGYNLVTVLGLLVATVQAKPQQCGFWLVSLSRMGGQ
ncbi:hypothetical protein GCM10009615_08670 [Corynebacterium durum]|jgi:hypothetical protein